MNRQTKPAKNIPASVRGFLFGSGRGAEKRISGAAVGLALLAVTLNALLCLHFGNDLASARADSDGGNISGSDLAEGPQYDPHYGHLFIDTRQDDYSAPDSSDPAETVSAEANPAETVSAEANPEETASAETDPEETASAETGTEETASAETGTEETDQTEKKPRAGVDMCHLSFEIHPDVDAQDTSVTLYGMMPEGATAQAVDVTDDFPDAGEVSDEAPETATVVAAYDITVTDGDREYQPGSSRPIRVEIAHPRIVTDGVTELWHIADDGSRERVENFSLEDGRIGFYATGFSIYVIVNGPDEYVKTDLDPVETVDDIGSDRAHSGGFYVAYKNSSGEYVYIRNKTNTKGALLETTDREQAAVWYFEPIGEKYRIFTLVSGVKKYIHSTGDVEIELTDSGWDSVEVSDGGPQYSFLLKKTVEDKWLQHSGRGSGIRYYGDTNNVSNSRMYLFYLDSGTPPDDYYGLGGKSYGLVNYIEGVEGSALMAEGEGNSLSMMSMMVRSDEQRDMILVAEDSDITVWTFTLVGGDIYRLSASVGGVTKYLSIGDTLTMTDESGASDIRVTVKDGMVRLGCGSRFVTLTAGGFVSAAASPGDHSQWLSLAELSGLSEEDYVTYTSDKISISDAPDGASVIVYTRVWNNAEKAYDFYAIDHNGTLVRCYERGDHIMWIGRQINTLLWNFIEYQYDDGSPKYYYELYNPYSRKFIAPQLRNGQILSDKKIGINLPGRREGKYYSTILAWDTPNYAFAGLRPDDADTRIISCRRDEADTFYFAMLNEPLKTLTKVATLDNNDFGITMRMINFDTPDQQNEILGNSGYNASGKSGLLSTDLKANGYPMAANGSFSDLFGGAAPVNHLFIDSIYRSSGYFEFDSTQNFATLVNERGEVGSSFTVYKELGTTDGTSESADRTTLKHGQFFPYDTITAGVYSYRNPENLYSASAVIGDPDAGLLPDSDPRKYEKLHTVGETPDYYNGMVVDAEFVQTPGGKDPWGHDVIFEFKGDDDFWLYVDGELVIDLGGIHSALSGSVNFSTGDVIVKGERTSLRSVIESNFKKRTPGATDAQTEAYLLRFFEPGKTVFKDYSAHTMKVFYMERGGGASNLHMRFNVTYLIPGHVLLTKKLNGTQDTDFADVQYPFQIHYKLKNDSTDYTLTSSTNNIRVTYQNSPEHITYRDVYRPPDSDTDFRSVYFLTPGVTAEIIFPENVESYRIVECGVNSEVYKGVYVNGLEVFGESIGSSDRKLYDTDWIDVISSPSIVFENYVDRDALRTLRIKKQLYDEAGNLVQPGEDANTFSYRIYLSNGVDDELKLANMRKYLVTDPDGYICRWDAESQSFEPLAVMHADELTEQEKREATFETSMNGAVSMIPAGYTVCVPDLPVGTRFRVVERDYEIPLGYSLIGYERQGETYLLEEGSDENTGWVRANESPTMTVNNRRGWELKVEKVWSDEQFVESHSPVYAAVYVGGSLLEGSVRCITGDDTTLRYFFDSLPAARTIADYQIREVDLTDPVVGSDGVVTGWSELTPLDEDDHVTVSSVPKGGGDESSNIYFVGYSEGVPERTAEDIPAPGNIRSDLILNTRSEGVAITLYDMRTGAPLADGIFRLTQGDKRLGTFTSDSRGRITIVYDVEHDENYTLTQTEAPESYIGVPEPIVFSVSSYESGHRVTITGNDDIWAKGHSASEAKPTDAKTTAAKRDASYADSPIIAYIDVFNKPFTLGAVKISDRSQTPLAGAKFALYRSVKVLGGHARDSKPMEGYAELVTGADGIIPGIDSSLPPGKYYLSELSAPQYYEGLSEDIIFTVSEMGFVTIDSEGHGDMLRQSALEYESAFTIVVPNTFEYSTANLTVTKTVTGAMGDIEHDFTFTLNVEGAQSDESYAWSRNGVEQTRPLRSGDSFTLRHGESISVTLPMHLAVTLTEDNEDYETTFTLDGEKAETCATKTFVLTGDRTLDVVNKRSLIVSTGIRLSVAWPAALLLLSLGGAVFMIMLRTGSKQGKDSEIA